MLYKAMVLVCSEIHTKQISALCGHNVEILLVKPGGSQSNRLDFKLDF